MVIVDAMAHRAANLSGHRPITAAFARLYILHMDDTRRKYAILLILFIIVNKFACLSSVGQIVVEIFRSSCRKKWQKWLATFISRPGRALAVSRNKIKLQPKTAQFFAEQRSAILTAKQISSTSTDDTIILILFLAWEALDFYTFNKS